MIRAVLFDAGATLLHAHPPIEEVYAGAFERDGVAGARERILEALGRTWSEIRRAPAGDRYGGRTGEREFWERFVRRTRFHLDGGEVSTDCFAALVAHFTDPSAWTVYPDVVPALEELRGAGLRLAIVSNWDSTLVELLEAHALSRRFDAVLVSALEGTGKPASEIFHRACRALSVDPAEALHVGDSLEEDYEAARTAGLSALLLDRDGRHPEAPERIVSLDEVGKSLFLLESRRS